MSRTSSSFKSWLLAEVGALEMRIGVPVAGFFSRSFRLALNFRSFMWTELMAEIWWIFFSAGSPDETPWELPMLGRRRSKLEDGKFPFSLTKDFGVNLVFTQRANGLQTGTHVQRWIKKKCNLLPNLFFSSFCSTPNAIFGHSTPSNNFDPPTLWKSYRCTLKILETI